MYVKGNRKEAGKKRENMKYTKEQRLQIGKEIYDGKITKYEAVDIYGIGVDSARDYMRLYRDTNALPPKNFHKIKYSIPEEENANQITKESIGISEIEAMSRNELINALITSRIREIKLTEKYAKLKNSVQ